VANVEHSLKGDNKEEEEEEDDDDDDEYHYEYYDDSSDDDDCVEDEAGMVIAEVRSDGWIMEGAIGGRKRKKYGDLFLQLRPDIACKVKQGVRFSCMALVLRRGVWSPQGTVFANVSCPLRSRSQSAGAHLPLHPSLPSLQCHKSSVLKLTFNLEALWPCAASTLCGG
jgi:hypothetical protein